MCKVEYLTLCMLICFLSIFSMNINEWNNCVDSISKLNEDVTISEIIKDDEKTYLSASFSTYEMSIQNTIKTLNKYSDSTTKLFPFVKRFDRILPAPSEKPTYFFETKMGIATSWAILKEDSVITDSTTFYRLLYSNLSDSALNAKWEDVPRGLIKIKYDYYSVVWIFNKIDEKHTRVGAKIAIQTKAFIPKWLYNLAAKRIFPKMLKNIWDIVSKDNA